MIKFFSKGFFIQYATVFLLGLMLWAPAFLSSSKTIEPDSWWGPLSFSINKLIPLLGFTGNIIAYFIIYTSGILINRITGYYGITDKSGVLPLLLFVIASSFVSDLTTLSPTTLYLPFIILLFMIFVRHDDENEIIMHSFDAGIIVGILTLFYYPLGLLVLLIWFALIILKGISWRNFVTSLTGWAFPSFLIYTWFLFTGQESVFTNHIYNIGLLSINTAFFTFSIGSALIMIMMLVVLLSAVKAMSQQRSLSIKQRNYYLIFGFYLVIILFINLFLSSGFLNVLLLAPASAITLNNLLANSKQTKWLNKILILFLLMIITYSWLSYYNVIQ